MIQHKVNGTVYGVILNDTVSVQKIGSLADAPYKGAPQAPVLYLKPANTRADCGASIRLPDAADSVEVAADGATRAQKHTNAMRLTVRPRAPVQVALTGSESFASPGLSYVKWTHPVRAGDALSLRATVLDKRTSASKPDLGILRWRWQIAQAGRWS